MEVQKRLTLEGYIVISVGLFGHSGDEEVWKPGTKEMLNVAAGLVALFMEWKKAGANAELHMYGDGKGPYELMPQTGETTTETWSTQMIHWLKAKGFVKKN